MTIVRIHVGLGAAGFIDLPTGGVVANIEGAVNDTTLVCNVTNRAGNQGITVWSVVNFEGVTGTRPLTLMDNLFLISGELNPITGVSFQNQITIVNWTLPLNEVTLFCGTGANLTQAGVDLRIYSRFFYTLVLCKVVHNEGSLCRQLNCSQEICLADISIRCSNPPQVSCEQVVYKENFHH